MAGITGFTAERGDQLVIDTLPFETTLLLEPPLPPVAPVVTPPPVTPLSTFLKLDRKMQMILGGSAGGLILVLIVGVMLMKRGRKKSRNASVAGPTSLEAGAGRSIDGAASAIGIEQQMESKLAERDARQQKLDSEALDALKVAPVITKAAEVLAKHLREKVTKEAEISAQILRSWIRDEEEI